MTSIDDLFRKPLLPPGSHKRKLDIPDPQQAYKSAKISNDHSPNSRHANGASTEDLEDDDDEDVEAGPELPPDEADVDDDEDGRFFGGGMTRSAAQALDYLDAQNGGDGATDDANPADERIDAAWLRRLAASFERKVTRNAEQRARHADEPAKFMESEAELDAEVKSWSLLSEHPELYGAFARSDALGQLVGLLAHENTDIAIGAIEIVAELLDEDVEVEQEEWDGLVAALLEADLRELLMSNMGRLDEENESDRDGVYHSLAILEKLASQQSVAERIGDDRVLLWLCNRIAKTEPSVGQNKQYAAEVLQVLLQVSPLLRTRLITELDGVDLFLRLLASYRRRDPVKESHEEEFVENIFDSLICVLEPAAGKLKFVEAEGVELCRLMLKEGTKNIQQRALRVLDHAVAVDNDRLASATVAEKIVDTACLKPLFSIFGKKSNGQSVEHLLGIFTALLRLLPGESASRIRTLAKFVEKDYEKVGQMVQLRTEYARRVRTVDKELHSEQRLMTEEEIDDRADESLSRRLTGGLFHLQTIDVILAWLVAEEPGVRSKLVDWLGSDGNDLRDIRNSLEAQKNDVGAGEGQEDYREMLDTLIEFLN